VTRVTANQVPALAGAVRSAARAISVELGFSPRNVESASPQLPDKVSPVRS